MAVVMVALLFSLSASQPPQSIKNRLSAHIYSRVCCSPVEPPAVLSGVSAILRETRSAPVATPLFVYAEAMGPAATIPNSWQALADEKAR